MGINRDQGYLVYTTNGASIELPPQPIIIGRAPTVTDSASVGTLWVDSTNEDVYVLASNDLSGNNWINCGGGSSLFSDITVENTVTFSAMGFGSLISSATGVISSINGTDGQLLVGGTGLAPAWASVTSGDGSVVITPGANTIDLTVSGATASSFQGDAGGVVLPALGLFDILGGVNCSTTGTPNTITIDVDNNPTFSGLVTCQAGITQSAGTTTITSDTNAADAIYLHVNGGVNETIRLHSSQGNLVSSVKLESVIGGITLSSGLATDDSFNIESSGGCDIDAAMQINITSSENATDSIRLLTSHASGGADFDFGLNGLTVDSTGSLSFDCNLASNFTVASIGQDLSLQSTLGSLNLVAHEAATDAIRVLSNSGGCDLDVVLQLNLDSSQAAVDAIRLNASGGGIDIDAVSSVTIDSASISLDATTASNFTVTGAADLTINSTLGSVIIGAEEAVADAIQLTSAAGGLLASTGLQMQLTSSQNAADAILINSSVAGIDIDAVSSVTVDAASISLDSTTGSNFTVTGAADLTINSTLGSVIIGAEEAVADAIQLTSAAGGLLASTGLQMQLTSSQNAADAILINSSVAGIDINAVSTITMDAAGISLDSSAAANFSTSGVGTDLTLQSAAGRVDIIAGEDTAQAIYLHANAGTSETIHIHSDQGTSDASVNITSDVGGLTLDGAGTGNIKLTPGTNTAAGTSITLNSKIGSCVFTGVVTASAAQETFTITDSNVSLGSDLLITVGNQGANDARLRMERYKTAAGSFTVDVYNAGGAACNGDVHISWIVLT